LSLKAPSQAPKARTDRDAAPTGAGPAAMAGALALPIFALRGEVIALAPNVLAVGHWERLLGGAIYAASPRVNWAALLKRRSMSTSSNVPNAMAGSVCSPSSPRASRCAKSLRTLA
jgi:hypothetical protein